MTSEKSEITNFLELKSNFEGQVGIYWEKFVCRVRVTDIQINLDQQAVMGIVTVIPTRGLLAPAMSSWSFGGGYLSIFSNVYWGTGYGAWSLYFDPRFVDSVVEQAATWAADIDITETGIRVSDILSGFEWQADPTFRWEKPRKIFPEAE